MGNESLQGGWAALTHKQLMRMGNFADNHDEFSRLTYYCRYDSLRSPGCSVGRERDVLLRLISFFEHWFIFIIYKLYKIHFQYQYLNISNIHSTSLFYLFRFDFWLPFILLGSSFKDPASLGLGLSVSWHTHSVLRHGAGTGWTPRAWEQQGTRQSTRIDVAHRQGKHFF